MTYYCGIDLHSTNSVVVIIDEADKIVLNYGDSNYGDAITVTVHLISIDGLLLWFQSAVKLPG